MQLVLAVAIALLIVAVVAWPLLMRQRNAPTPPVESGQSVNENTAALNAVYDAIRTLQTEHGLGRVNDDDYQEQLDEYRRQAARILREMDRERGEEQDG